MITGHVFIVNEQTLPIHLKNMFVGTSSREKDNNISLLADMLRIKTGDLIFFYIEGTKIRKGRFFGLFQAVEDVVYHLTGPSAQNPDLPLKLIYRKKIKPYQVYSKGVLEWVALDKLPTYAKELLWTLIYRKMKGGRGNTMLLPWELERLISLIRSENNGEFMQAESFSLDSENCQIIPGEETNDHNIGTPIRVSEQEIRKREVHFQAFLLQNLKLGNNNFYPEIFGKNIVWIGNELFAGSGMQKIDIFIIEKLDETRFLYRLIELKHPKSSTNVNFSPGQLDYYINWSREDLGGHIIGGRNFNLKPILLALTPEFNAIPIDIVSQIRGLDKISFSPEIWEMNLDLIINRIL